MTAHSLERRPEAAGYSQRVPDPRKLGVPQGGGTRRTLVTAALLGLLFLLASPVAVQARDLMSGGAGYRGAPSHISLHVSVGYQDVYRDTTWTPVRVALHNGMSADVSGTLEIPQSSQSPSLGSSQSFHGLYQAPVVLPAGSTKHVTLYVQGFGVQGRVEVAFRERNRTLASVRTYPMGIDSSALFIGMTASNPGDAAWVVQAMQQQVTTHVVQLSPATLDPVPEALAAFDIIVLTNVDTSQLDRAQLSALERYVHNGGSLLLIGGPTWQATLRPLPAALLPGRLIGTRTVPDLHGLLPLDAIGSYRDAIGGHNSISQSGAGVRHPASAGRTAVRGYPLGVAEDTQATAVSVLSHPTGAVLASQAGIPLVVRKMVGHGVIEYLAFDPALTPAQGLSAGKGTPPVLEHLVAMAAPLAISRTWAPLGFRGRFLRAFRSVALTTELSNLPPATLPLLAIFAVLTLVYILFLGPANFLVLRWMKRQQLAWITIPALALSYLGSTFGITMHFKGSTARLNSVGMVTLDGSGAPAGRYPATFYVGLVAPLAGDYHLKYHAASLPASIPQLDHLQDFSWRSASTLKSTPLGVRLQEGSQTDATFLSMKSWSMRDVSLDTTVHIPGTVQSDLSVDAQGDIAGRIHNGTNLDLLAPVIVAGQTVVHLPDIAAGATTQARVRPSTNGSGQDQSSVWSHLYGGSSSGLEDGFRFFHGCCDQFSYPQEKNLINRVRNASAMLSQLQTFSSLGQVVLAGWSEQPLGTFTVDGSAPQRRDLTLILMPLSVHFPHPGIRRVSFRLRAGTLGARLVDIVPRAPQSNCCSFFSRNDQQLSIGAGGSVTFEFDTPNAGAQGTRFQHLELSVNGSGTSAGSVYEWRAHRWVNVDLSGGTAQLSNPNRFVSPDGRILLKLQATAASGDITIDNPYQDVQISGVGTTS